MLKERRAIVTGIHERLGPAETSLDEAIGAIASLAAHLPQARAAAGLALEVGHEALEAVSEAQALVVRARAKLIECHRVLAAAQQHQRFPEIADGGLGSKDPNGVLQARGLRVVDAGRNAV